MLLIVAPFNTSPLVSELLRPSLLDLRFNLSPRPNTKPSTLLINRRAYYLAAYSLTTSVSMRRARGFPFVMNLGIYLSVLGH